MSVGDIIYESGKYVGRQPVDVGDFIAGMWRWILQWLPDWAYDSIAAVFIILGVIVFVICASTGKGR